MSNQEMIIAYNQAQAAMGKAIKNQKNDYLGNSYANLEAVQEATMAAFQANGFAIAQLGGADEYGEYVETVLLHSSGGQLSSKVYLEVKKSDMQSKGSAITYARRYGLTMITGVPVADDDGNGAMDQSELQNKTRAKVNGIKTFLLSGPTLEQMKQKEKAAQTILLTVKTFDAALYEEIAGMWRNRMTEVGLLENA